MKNNLITIAKNDVHEIDIKKSRFICHLARVKTEEEAKIFIEQIKKQYNNATHNCSCYCIGDNDEIQKANDDGEPTGTAGIPMLEVLKKHQIKDTVAVVTRYFGGIKLGAGGLIRAYGKAVSESIQMIGLVIKKIVVPIDIVVDYTLTGKLEHALHNSDYIMLDTTWTDKVTYHIQVPIEQVDDFKLWLADLTSQKHHLLIHSQQYIELKYTSQEN